MNTKTIKMSRKEIIQAQKEYKKWTENMDDEIPNLVNKHIEDLVLVIHGYESQIEKYGREACLKWDMNAWITYSLCNFLALKFRKCLIKMWDKEYPVHLEESLKGSNKLLLYKYKYDFGKRAKIFDDPNYKSEDYHAFSK